MFFDEMDDQQTGAAAPMGDDTAATGDGSAMPAEGGEQTPAA